MLNRNQPQIKPAIKLVNYESVNTKKHQFAMTATSV